MCSNQSKPRQLAYTPDSFTACASHGVMHHPYGCMTTAVLGAIVHQPIMSRGHNNRRREDTGVNMSDPRRRTPTYGDYLFAGVTTPPVHELLNKQWTLWLLLISQDNSQFVAFNIPVACMLCAFHSSTNGPWLSTQLWHSLAAGQCQRRQPFSTPRCNMPFSHGMHSFGHEKTGNTR